MSDIQFKAIEIKHFDGEKFHFNCEEQALEFLHEDLFSEAKILYMVDGQAAMATFTDFDALKEELS